VVYRANDGHIYELFVNATGHWVAHQLTGAASAPTASGNPFGYVTGETGQHVVYRANDGNIYELFTNAAGSWTRNNLSAKAGAPI
jgi:predicted NUDIX family NTP pyrophosphohydrolase